uniref:Decapping nuclease n=1 Tax=Acrobeloides nanus TaxID=290746 RepID=A0A914BWB9_9BILA
VKPSTSEPVSTWNEFTVVFRSTIGPKGSELNVLYGAEVDCINRKGEYVELKTQFKALGIGRFYDSKTMKWWIQSYLAGIRKIFVGIRTDRGIVNSIEEVVVNELRDKAQKWQASICMKFLHTFLHRVRDILFSSPEGTILLAERNPSQEHVQFTKLFYEMPEYEKYNLLTEEFKLYFSPRGLKRSYS